MYVYFYSPLNKELSGVWRLNAMVVVYSRRGEAKGSARRRQVETMIPRAPDETISRWSRRVEARITWMNVPATRDRLISSRNRSQG